MVKDLTLGLKILGFSTAGLVASGIALYICLLVNKLVGRWWTRRRRKRQSGERTDDQEAQPSGADNAMD